MKVLEYTVAFFNQKDTIMERTTFKVQQQEASTANKLNDFLPGSYKKTGESFLNYRPNSNNQRPNEPLTGRVTAEESRRSKSTPTTSDGGGGKASRGRAVTLPATSTKTSDLSDDKVILTKLEFFFQGNEFTIKSDRLSDDQKSKLKILETLARRILVYASIINMTAEYEDELLFVGDIEQEEKEEKLKFASSCARKKIFTPIDGLNISEFDGLIRHSNQARELLILIQRAPKALEDLLDACTFSFEE